MWNEAQPLVTGHFGKVSEEVKQNTQVQDF